MNTFGNHKDDKGMVHVLSRFDELHHKDETTITRYVCMPRDKWFWGKTSDATKEKATCLACIAAK